jgi:hypothetical protein
MRQQTNFSAFSNKQGTLCARLKTRETSNSSQLCSCIGPLSASHRWVTSSHPMTPLLVTSGSYGLLCTSGFHRPLGLCEGRQSWRQPNGNQPATSNCNIHDPVTRRLHRQHLVHPRLVGLRAAGLEQIRLRVLGRYFFRKWGRGPRWEGPGSEPRGFQLAPQPTAAPAGCWRLAGRGKGREGGAPHRP